MLKDSNIYKDTKPSDWFRVLMFMHKNGWLYFAQEDGEIVLVVGMYRIKKFNLNDIKKLPEKEEGDILYIPFFASHAKDKMLPRKLLKQYLDNHKNIKEIAFYANDKKRSFKRVRSRKNGKRKSKTT